MRLKLDSICKDCTSIVRAVCITQDEFGVLDIRHPCDKFVAFVKENGKETYHNQWEVEADYLDATCVYFYLNLHER